MKHIFITLIFLVGLINNVFSCTNIIVTKGASSNGSNMIVYTCDGEFHPHLRITPAAVHEEGDSLNIYNYSGQVLGKIAQVPHTYKVMGYSSMNEHQVAMGETTFGGREELLNTDKFLHYWTLMNITLQRSRSAREAIKVLTELVETYGYASSGESISICDKDEAWLLEIIGTGPGGEGAIWVALRIPDGYICAHANKARIGEFPLDDPENCLYSDNVIDFAIAKGYYDPKSGEAFHFNETYDPSNPGNLRYCETRVWSIFRRAAPSQSFSPDYHRGVIGAKRYPLWIKPDEKIGVGELMTLIRDHYEGTPYDETKNLAAGAYGNPNRWRPLVWEANKKEASWERCISTYNTGYSIITQSRSELPDEIGGLVWYGVDDTYFTCYVPIYICMDTIPEAYRTGNLGYFSMESAWWVFNLVSNYTCLKYSHIITDVQKWQNRIETEFLQGQEHIENIARKKYSKDKDMAKKYLSNYSFEQLKYVFTEWSKLSNLLIVKYNDGYIKDGNGRPQDAGYPEYWYEQSVKDNPGYYMPVWEDHKKTKEPDMY